MGNTPHSCHGVFEHAYPKLFGALLVFFPLAMVFTSGVGGDGVSGNNFSSIVNYAALIWALLINLILTNTRPKNLNPRQEPVVLFLALLFITYLLNYIAAEYASGKWFVNNIGFIFIFFSIVVSLERLDDVGISNLHSGVDRAVVASMIVLLFMNLAIILLDTSRFFKAVQVNDFSAILFFWTKHFYASKPPICLVFLIIVLWNATNWSCMSFKRQLFFVAFLIVTYPLWMGIRTLGLALVLVLAYWLAQRWAWFRLVALGILSLGAIGVGARWEWAIGLVSKYYDRLPSLLFAFEVLANKPLGLGNGGYHVFVREFNNSILARFGRDDMGYFFWLSPESDLVYLIASFGWLSLVFFGIFIFLIIKGGAVLRSSKTSRIEKFLILSSISFIFSGISQYNAGGLVWWIYMAAGIAVLIKCDKKVRLLGE